MPAMSSAGSSAGDARIAWGFVPVQRFVPQALQRWEALGAAPLPSGGAPIPTGHSCEVLRMLGAGCGAGLPPTHPGRLCLLCPTLSLEELMHSRNLSIRRGLKCPHCLPCFLHAMPRAVTPWLGCGCIGWVCKVQEQHPRLRYPLVSVLGLAPVITWGIPTLCFPDGSDAAPGKGQSPPCGLVLVARFLQSAVCLCHPVSRCSTVISRAQGRLCVRHSPTLALALREVP